MLNRHNTDVTHCCGSFGDDCYCSEQGKRKRSRYFPFLHPRLPNFPLPPKSFRYFFWVAFPWRAQRQERQWRNSSRLFTAASRSAISPFFSISSPKFISTLSNPPPSRVSLTPRQGQQFLSSDAVLTVRPSLVEVQSELWLPCLFDSEKKVSQLREELRANVFLLSTNSLLPHSPPFRTLSPPLLPPPSVSIHSSARAHCLFAQIQLTKTRKFTITESSERSRGKAAD